MDYRRSKDTSVPTLVTPSSSGKRLRTAAGAQVWSAMLGNKLQLKRKEAVENASCPAAEVAEPMQPRLAAAGEQAVIANLLSGRPLPPSCQEQLASLASLLLGGPRAASQPPRPLPTPSLLPVQHGRAPPDEDSNTLLQLAGICPGNPASQPAQWAPASPFPGFGKTLSDNRAAADARHAGAALSHSHHALAQASQQAGAGAGYCMVQQRQVAAHSGSCAIGKQQQCPGDAKVTPFAAPAEGQQPGKAAEQQHFVPKHLTSMVRDAQQEAACMAGESFGRVMAACRQQQPQMDQGQQQQQQLAQGKSTAPPLQQQPEQQVKDTQRTLQLAVQKQPRGLDVQARKGQQAPGGGGKAGTAGAVGLPAAVKECPICGLPFAVTDSAAAVQTHIEACLNGEAAELFCDD